MVIDRDLERYEVISPSLNGYAYIHDFKTDNVLNTYDSCDLLNQQSKRIKELEKENQQLKQQLKEYSELGTPKEIDDTYRSRNILTNNLQEANRIIDDLVKQLATTEKALEMACERVKYFEEMQGREMGHFEFFGYDNEYDLQSIIEQYKQQAKEMLENE